MPSLGPLRLGYVSGATPDKWVTRWRERHRRPLDLVPVSPDQQRAVLDQGLVDLLIARLPIHSEGLHVVKLYDELPVAVVAKEHPASAYDELSIEELLDEQFVLGPPSGVHPTTEQLPFAPMTAAEAVEVAASGSGIVILPMSVARLHHRRDVSHVPITDLPTTTIALTWLQTRDDDDAQAFVGIVKGRTARSTR